MKIQSINPATLKINKEYSIFTKEKVLQICKKSRRAFSGWRDFSIAQRCEHLYSLAAVLTSKKNEYAKLITVEMGKPILQSIAEIEKCVVTVKYYADHAEAWLADEIIPTDAQKSFVTHEPLGVILSTMPWNFPFWQLIRFAVPALAVGNTVILRHSSSVPMCAMALEEAFKLAQFPQDIFRTILSDHHIIKKLLAENYIDGISLTGSVAAGRQVGEIAGKNIKKFVLELGGADPFIVLADADIDAASLAAAEGRNINSGQSCVAAKRFIVVKEVAAEFTEKFVHAMQKLQVGDPLDETTTTGPLANAQQLKLLASQVNRSVKMGAKIQTGGKKIFNSGYFYAPTVLTHIKKNMPVFNEEVFGPVAPIIIVKDTEEALKLANESRLGLGASLWTADLNNADRLARQIESGMVFVNSIVKSDPRLPFGGIKDSGVGRELSHYGLLEFVNTKTIYINK